MRSQLLSKKKPLAALPAFEFLVTMNEPVTIKMLLRRVPFIALLARIRLLAMLKNHVLFQSRLKTKTLTAEIALVLHGAAA